MEPVMTQSWYETSLTAGVPHYIGERVIIPFIKSQRICHGGGVFMTSVPVGIYVIEQDVEYFFPLSENIRDYSETAAFHIDEVVALERRRFQGRL